MKKIDLIDVVETAYDLGDDDEAWLPRMLEVSRAGLDSGQGLFGFLYFADRQAGLQVHCAAMDGLDPDILTAAVATNVAAPPDVMRELFFDYARTVGTYRQMQREVPAAADFFAAAPEKHASVVDLVALNARDPSGHGLIFGAPASEDVNLRPRFVQRWQRVATHLAAGYRLRRALVNLDTAPAVPLGGDAVFDPGGALKHAEPDAKDRSVREKLKDAVKRVDRARSTARKDTDEALALWQGLSCGRYSLVDWFDADGRRFVIARKNDSPTPDPRALSMKERQVSAWVALGQTNKQVGYEVGIAASTVAYHLARAQRKLGLQTRGQLVALLRAANVEPDKAVH